MRKFAAILLAALMMVSAAACSTGSGTSSAADAASTADGASSEETADNSEAESTTGDDSAAADDSWDKIVEKGEIVLGMDDAFPPMGYTDTTTGEIIGFDVDVATEVFSRLGVELKLQPIEWSTKEMELDGGNVDLLWNGYSYTEERAEKQTLSDAYMKNNQVILVKEDSSYQSLADLAGKSLGVQSDSSAESALESEEATEFRESLGEIVPIDDYSKAILEIQNGLIEAIAIDEVVARFYLTNDPGAYRILEKEDGTVESLAVEDYVIGFRKGDQALCDKVNETLKEMKADGTLAEISEKWFGEDVTTIEA
ncbi:MAG: amino acid ABC transporter substrate-binding protein [Clostridiales bacterium]|nr:amino acid ABC transporter substrate-binding protein [Clostridiales bacterium]PWM40449.1 MAG: amino acid ABC transporter substrate-binding protein [Clostridiales bacterium]